MSKFLAGLAAAGAALALPCGAPPLETYGKLPTIQTVSISPDGAKLAMVLTDGERRVVAVETVEPFKLLTKLNAGMQKVRALQWAGADRLILTTSTTGYIAGIDSPRLESLVAGVYDLKNKSQKALLTNARDVESLNTINGLPKIRFVGGRPIAFVDGVSFVDNAGRDTLFRVDLEGTTTTIISQGREHTDDFAIDGRGQPLAETEYDATNGRWTLRLWKGHWVEALQTQQLFSPPYLLGPGRDGASALVAFNEANHTVLRELSPATGAWSADLPTVDPDEEFWDRATSKLIALSTLVGDERHYDFFDPQDQKVWRALVAAYPGAQVSLVSFSDDRKKFVIRVDSPTEGPAFALVDLNTRKGRWIGDEYQGLKPVDVAPVRSISFKAADGLVLTGYLTLPAGKDAKKLPLVVFPHGGPASRDTPGFDWWAQAMASRGYAVLQVNYRGSDGLGWDFMSAGFGQWGRKMQTDLSDGVRYLSKAGIVDPARVCIVGASYGGYAALAGATLDLGVYRCAASIAGPADLRKMIDWDKAQEGRQGVGSQRYWVRYMGPYAALAEISPAEQAARATIPILLVRGKDDTVVAYEQSQIMAEALRKAGEPVEFVTLKSEDHWLSRGETRLQILQSVVAFLEKNNPP